MGENSQCSGASTCGKSSCEGCASAKKKNGFLVDLNKDSSVKAVIGIVSGKGGVGKSSVTASLACALRKKGYKVGIMDADITGPSIPKMFGVHGPLYGTEECTPAPEAEDGTKLISMNIMLDDEEQPVIWRGPVIAGVVKQFWTDITWGELDFMLVDMPPGTGDVPLTVFQSLPLSGIVVVTSPQELVSMIVKKAVNMADKMDVPVLGIVENFSYFRCDSCGKEHHIFGESRIGEVADEMGLDILGKLPFDTEFAKLCDEGRVFDADRPELASAVKAAEKLL